MLTLIAFRVDLNVEQFGLKARQAIGYRHVIELFQHAVQLAANPLVLADAKDLGDLVGGETKYSQLTGALEDLVNRKFRWKMKFRQYSTWSGEYSRPKGMAARSFFDYFGPSRSLARVSRLKA